MALLALAAPAWGAGRSRLAILNVKTVMLPAELGGILTEILTTEVADLNLHDVVAASDIASMLGFEKEKELAGCTDAACLADIGGALGVEYLIVSDVAAVGGTYVVNIKLINIRKAQVENRVYETVKGTQDVLIVTLSKVVCRLFPTVRPCGDKEAAPPSPATAEPAGGASRPAPAVPPAAVPAVKPGASHKVGLFLGAGIGKDKREAGTWYMKEDGPAAPYVNLFFRSRYLDADLGGAPPAMRMSTASASVALKPFRFVGFVVKWSMMGTKIESKDTTSNDGWLYLDSQALLGGLLLAPGGGLRLALMLGPTLGTRSNVVVDVTTLSNVNEKRTVDYEASGGNLAAGVELEYFFSKRWAARFVFGAQGGEPTIQRRSDLLNLARSPPEQIFVNQMMFLFSLGYDMAPWFAD